ncbi:MAG TPA: uroporphyrinogen decarboxylase family protein [bacterium]|nr:uroporphyrinogen decarboxylase family protein [bacterium]
MTHRERIDTAVRGDRPDHVPVALWRHFPVDDQRAERMADVHVAHYRAYAPDLLKVTPASGYYGDDWGLHAGYKPNREGVRHYTDRPVKKAADWGRLKRLDLSQGAYGREVHAIRLIAEAVGREVPVLETVFSPLSVARTLAGEQATVRYLREDPEALHRGLDVIADVTAEFVRELMGAGADGIFFSTQMATNDLLTEEEYEEFGRPYDLRVLEAARSGLVFLHLHGQNVMFDLIASYPIQVLNWHARETPPTIAEARARVSTCLGCGIDAWNTLAKATPEAVAREVQSAIADTGGRGHIVTTGCVMPVDTPEANIRAAIAAAHGV